MLFRSACYLALVARVCAQDLLTVLSSHPGLTTFTRYLQQYPALVDELNQGPYTVLAPNDAAFQKASNPDSDELQAVLRYHAVKGQYVSVTFNEAPAFRATLLTNKKYANVTGGQRVELVRVDNGPVIRSALKKTSQITTADILFIGGFVHIIDLPLTIPLDLSSTISAAGLDYLDALLAKGGFINAQEQSFQSSLSDVAVFGPNNPSYGADFTGWDGKSTADLDKILLYSIAQNSNPLYSPQLTNNTRFQTMEGEDVRVTKLEGVGTFIDAAEITDADYLISSGVLHVLDSPLNPNTSHARPDWSKYALPQQSTSSAKHSLSSGVIAGIVLGSIAFLGTCVVLGSFIARRHRLKTERERGTQLPARQPSELEGKPRSPRNIALQRRHKHKSGVSAKELDASGIPFCELESGEQVRRASPPLPPLPHEARELPASVDVLEYHHHSYWRVNGQFRLSQPFGNDPDAMERGSSRGSPRE